MKFKKYLNELFDTNINVNVYNRGNDFYELTFTVDEKEYEVEIYKMSRNDEWTITFFDFEGDEELTGGGGKNVFKIFTGVIKSVDIVLKKEKPEKIFFTAKGQSRIKLYDKFAKMLVKKTGYKLSIENGPEKKYMFDRK